MRDRRNIPQFLNRRVARLLPFLAVPYCAWPVLAFLRKGGNVAACCHEIFAESTPGLHAVSHPPFAKNAKDGAPHSLRCTSEIKGGPPAMSSSQLLAGHI